MGVQVTVSANQIDKERLGYCAISLTHFYPTDTAEPSIVAGSKVEVGGALYEFTGDETGTGWAGVGVSNTAYFYLVPAGASISWTYSTTAPTWDTAKQGWYDGANRCFGFLWKDAAGLYQAKELLGPLTASLGKLRHLPLNNALSRQLYSAGLPNVGVWSGPFSGAGVVGVPTIAKGILARVQVIPFATGGGAVTCDIGISDNNANVPTFLTAHPVTSAYGVAAGGGGAMKGSPTEVVIPLNTSNQWYFYSIALVNVTVGTSFLNVSALGYYVGD